MDEEYTDFGPGGVMREVYDWIESGVMAVICVILVFTFFGRLVGVVGDSMTDTLKDQDRLVVVGFMYEPRGGDIVVASKPNVRNEPLIKRIIAVGGQTVDIDYESGRVLVDGRALNEDYILEPMDPAIRSDFEFPLAVPDGYVFLMGDNRNYSWDSRFEGVGLVDKRHILGRVLYRVAPFNAIGDPNKGK